MVCFKCDRCGEVFDWYTENGFNGIAKIESKEYSSKLTVGEGINLCPSCMAALNDWLKGEQK